MILNLIWEILNRLIIILLALLSATRFFHDFVINYLAYISVSIYSLNILAHHAMYILWSQIVSTDFACGFIWLVSHEPTLLLLCKDCMLLLLVGFVLILLTQGAREVDLLAGAELGWAEIMRCTLLITLCLWCHVAIRHFSIIWPIWTIESLKVLDMINIYIAQVILRLVQLLLDLFILLLLLLLRLQRPIDELKRRYLVIDMQLSHQQALLANLVLLILQLIHLM